MSDADVHQQIASETLDQRRRCDVRIVCIGATVMLALWLITQVYLG
jgi:hypothetical protein